MPLPGPSRPSSTSPLSAEIPEDASPEEIERIVDDAKVAVVKFVRRQVRRGASVREAWIQTARKLAAERHKKRRPKGTEAPKD